MSYRPPSRPPKGRWANFIHEQRRAFGWSQAKAFKELRAGLGFGEDSRAAYAKIDMGDRQPTPKEAEYLRSVFGEPPDEPEPAPQPSGDQAALVAAMREQTAAIAEALDRQTQALNALVMALALRDQVFDPSDVNEVAREWGLDTELGRAATPTEALLRSVLRRRGTETRSTEPSPDQTRTASR